MTSLKERLENEADMCRNDGAHDIAKLLDEAARFVGSATLRARVVIGKVALDPKRDFERDFLRQIITDAGVEK